MMLVCIVLQVVSAAFDELNLEPHYGCSYDSVSGLYDGSSRNSASLGRFCTIAAWTVASSGSSLFVVFRADHNVNKGRCFALNWTFVSQDSTGSK